MKKFIVTRNSDGVVIQTIFHTCVTNAADEFIAGMELPGGSSRKTMSRILALVWRFDNGRVVVDYRVEASEASPLARAYARAILD